MPARAEEEAAAGAGEEGAARAGEEGAARAGEEGAARAGEGGEETPKGCSHGSTNLKKELMLEIYMVRRRRGGVGRGREEGGGEGRGGVRLFP